MTPVVTIDMPNPNDFRLYDIGSQVFLAPPKTSRPPGRPRVERIESQFRNKKIYHCSSCHEEGHTRRTCKNPNPT
ncbi:hypothetical protein QN277_014630 [Acacia crassicarpa]|uniref:CCHC-type domain-containing protein n=1 Tax=Acacia crassicarpa TaxID=499986 RepID=A0AAE1MV25_9FABA|nr:hypothetical protein QN277_014630 [Acacia crassicarpa]